MQSTLRDITAKVYWGNTAVSALKHTETDLYRNRNRNRESKCGFLNGLKIIGKSGGE
jgi:hypothetical protein